MTNTLTIRVASDADIAGVVAVEAEAWKNEGTEIYDAPVFEAWRRVHPDGFYIAEVNDRIVGYTYGQRVTFSREHIQAYTSCNKMTDHGYSIATHEPEGNFLYGMCVASIYPGAGTALIHALYDLTDSLPGVVGYVAFPRISGFDAYMQGLESSGEFGTIPPALERDIARWYAMTCTRMVGCPIWETAGPIPERDLPPPATIDPVLPWHLKRWHKEGQLGMTTLIPGYMQDAKSRDYIVMISTEI